MLGRFNRYAPYRWLTSPRTTVPAIFNDERSILLYLSALSLVLLAVHSILPYTPVRYLYASLVFVGADEPKSEEYRRYTSTTKWETRFWQGIRFLACIVLTGLAFGTLRWSHDGCLSVLLALFYVSPFLSP